MTKRQHKMIHPGLFLALMTLLAIELAAIASMIALIQWSPL